MVMEPRELPSARYISIICPKCKQRFWSDQGKKYDRHEYIIHTRRTSAKCPLCSHSGSLDQDAFVYGVVQN